MTDAARAFAAPAALLAALAAGCVTTDPPPVRNDFLLGLRTPDGGPAVPRVRTAAFPDLHALLAAGLPPEEGSGQPGVVWWTEDSRVRLPFLLGRGGSGVPSSGDRFHTFRLEFTVLPPKWTREGLPVIWFSVEDPRGAEGVAREFVVVEDEASGGLGIFRWLRDPEGSRRGPRVGLECRLVSMAEQDPWILEMEWNPGEDTAP